MAKRIVLLFLIALYYKSAKSIYITTSVCDFEAGTCGWSQMAGVGTSGIIKANESNHIGHPVTDFNPGTKNGSYFFFMRPEGYINQVVILFYPTQKFIANMSFAFYMTGPQTLRISQVDVKTFDIVSNNQTLTWEQISLQFGTPYPGLGIVIESPSLSGGELGEAPVEGSFYLAIDNIIMTYALPCDFSALNIPGNLQISHQSYLDIPLGYVTYVHFTASSTICPNGPFIYVLEYNNVTELSNIFYLNSTTGILTVNATGPYLIGRGIPLGIITVSVHVQDSDFMQAGVFPKKMTVLHFQQDPTIIVYSPSAISIEIETYFSYILNSTSTLNDTLYIASIQSSPPSLINNITINGSQLMGIVTNQNLVDIIKTGTTSPSFTITIRNSYNETLNHTIQLIIPNQTPPVFTNQHYHFHIQENNNAQNPLVGDILIGEVGGISCETLSAEIISSDSNVTGTFSLLLIPFLHVLPNFCTFRLIATTSLDYEYISTYSFSIAANDSRGYTATAIVTVLVDGVNEYSPVITPDFSTITVSDYKPNGSLVVLLSATDNDKGDDGELSYIISEGNTEYFSLDKISNNQVKVIIKHSPIQPDKYLIVVTVSDNGKSPKSDTATVIVTVIASGEINCTEALYGPPVTTGYTAINPPPVYSDVTLQCNFTSNPLNYPIHWYKSSSDNPFLLQPITSNDHYTIAANLMTIHSITLSDVKVYTCNVTNQCGSATSVIFVHNIIQYPAAPTNLAIIQGPTSQSVTISWIPSIKTTTSPVSGYNIQLKEKGENYKTYQMLTYYSDDNIKVSETELSGLQPGTNYTVRVYSTNQYFQNGSNEIYFKTNTSAPRLSYLLATAQVNNTLMIEWKLEYTGGSHDVHMIITVQSNPLRRKRSLTPVTLTYDVNVHNNILFTPVLPFGRHYEILSVVSNDYGSREHTATAFIGIEDTLYCPFSLHSSCHWELNNGVLTQASSTDYPKPSIDPTGNSSGVYVLGYIENSLETLPLLSFPTISYMCGFSFYYQVYGNIRLTLESNESSLIWASPLENSNRWNYVEVPSGEYPLTLSTQPLVFSMEAINTPSLSSFVAVDEVSLHFCLPCNYTYITTDDIKFFYQNQSTIYIRNNNIFTIQTIIKDCPNPILQYTIDTVVPNQLSSKITIPNGREGVILVNDVTSDMVQIGTTDVVAADYKHAGNILSKDFMINFVISERIENCSYLKYCDFENGVCEWSLSNQANTSIATLEGNNVLYSKPLIGSNNYLMTVGEQTINDSYCGVNFLLLTSNVNLQVLVTGIGIVWSSWSSDSHYTTATSKNYSQWRNIAVYLDINQVDAVNERKIILEIFADNSVLDNDNQYVAIDNITLQPCINCEAKECNCISCIQQCSVDPCQDGYYLSLEINKCRLCPFGHYCENWRSLPMPCPAGTFNNMTGASRLSQCQVCPNGTFTLQKGSETCEPCPLGYNCSNPAAIPNKISMQLIQRDSVNTFVAAVVGLCVGVVLISILVTIIACFYCCQRRKIKQTKRRKEHQMYADNFYVNPDKHSGGYKSSTIRTASTILSMMGKQTDSGNKAYQNPAYADSDDSSDDFSHVTTLTDPSISRDPTATSLNSLDAKVDWNDINPFVSTSHSESNVSALIELEDKDDHVWDALQRKKCKKDSNF